MRTSRIAAALDASETKVKSQQGQIVELGKRLNLALVNKVEELARYRSEPRAFNRSEAAWSKWLPKVELGSSYAWLGRELQWDAYTVRSDATYEECAGRHILSQGGYYQYDTGANLGYRSWPHYLLPMTYADPALTRDVLRYTIVQQPPPPTPAVRQRRSPAAVR